MDIGTRIAHFEILAPLGAGGMGEVFRARDVRLGRELALKLVRAQAVGDGRATERFIREARAASALNHPNIVTIYDIGESERGWFIAMELVRGRTLASLAGAPVPLALALDVGAQCARALAVAHDAGIVHRDIKPENLMLREDGYAKILDFGLARLLRAGAEPNASPDTTATQPGMVLGTARYFSPEQACGEPLGAPTDVFALGLVLYELIAGEHPFGADSAVARLAALMTREPAGVSGARRELGDVGAPLDALLARLLAKDAGQRATAHAAAEGLTDLLRALGAAPHASAAGRLGPRRGDSGAVDVGSGFGTAPGGDSAAVTLGERGGSAGGAGGAVIVGRGRDRARIVAALAGAAGGRGQLLCITGEPGIGKTTLAEAVLADAARGDHAPIIARGRCSERLAGTAAYLPIVEALERALHHDTTGAVREVVRRSAPTWYAHVAGESADGVAARPAEDLRAASPERMMREFVALLEAAVRHRPTVFFIDDLHWADASTVDLLAYVGARLDRVGVLVIGTYRPEEMRLAKHPFLRVQLDLQARGLCSELAVDFLSVDDVREYLGRRYPDHRFPDDLATALHAKTEGNPLFLADVLQYLGGRGVIADFEGHWRLVGAVPDAARDIPPTIRGMIQRKIDQLADTDRRVLTAASVQGYAFDSAVVAAALGADPAEVEEQLVALDHAYAFVQRVSEDELPDRTLTVRYRFVHVLYQNALHAALAPSRRVALAAQVAAALEARWGAKATALASELAVLWETARQPAKAAGYYAAAAQVAAATFSYAEAEELARRGLAQVEAIAEPPVRAAAELPLRVSLGFTNLVRKGFHHPDTAGEMERARELCRSLGAVPQLAPVLWGLCVYHIASGEPWAGRGDADELLAIAAETGDRLVTVAAVSASAGSGLYVGQLRRSVSDQRRVESEATADERARLRQLVGSDPVIMSRCTAMRAAWMFGDFASARAWMDTATREAERSRDPRERAFVAMHCADTETQIGDPAAAERIARDAVALCEEYGVASELLWSAAYQGVALIQAGDRRAGIDRLRSAVEALQSIQSFVMIPSFHAQLALALVEEGELDAARAAVDAGASVQDRTREPLGGAELHRARAACIVASAPTEAGPARSAALADAAAELRRAVDAARAIEGLTYECRAVVSLAGVLRESGEVGEARALLLDMVDRWPAESEGRDAAALHAQLRALGHADESAPRLPFRAAAVPPMRP